jgi:hypothetical protein
MPSDHYFEELYGVTEERALNFWTTNRDNITLCPAAM